MKDVMGRIWEQLGVKDAAWLRRAVDDGLTVAEVERARGRDAWCALHGALREPTCTICRVLSRGEPS